MGALWSTMRSHRSPHPLAATVGLLAVMALAVSSSASAADDQRLKARGSGVIAPATVSCPAGFTPLSLTGSGRARYLGRFTWASTECFNFAAFVTVEGRFTLTAANGDALTGTYSGGATGPVAGVASFEDQALITGGTGRFASATGQFRVNGQANIAAMTFEHRLSGTITRADDDEDEDNDDREDDD